MRKSSGIAERERSTRSDAGLSDEQVDLLRQDFAQLEPIDADLPKDVLRFVLEGEGPEVLGRISARPESGEALGFHRNNFWLRAQQLNREARARFFDGPPADNPLIYLRLAQVYAAAAQSASPPNPGNLGIPYWIELFVAEAGNPSPSPFFRQPPTHARTAIPASLVEKVIAAGGEPADLLARTVVLVDPRSVARYHLQAIISLMGFGEMLASHPEVIIEGLNQSEADRKIYVLELLQEHKIDPTPFLGQIVDLAVSSAKTVRKAAESLIGLLPYAAIPTIQAKAASGTNDERILAAQLLWRTAGEMAREDLADRKEKETNARVKAAIEELLTEAKTNDAQAAPPVELPPMPPIDLLTPLSAEARAAFVEMMRQGFEAFRKHAERYPQAFPNLKAPSDDEVEGMIRFIEGTGQKPALSFNTGFHSQAAQSFAARPDVDLIHVVRLVDMLSPHGDYQFFQVLGHFLGQYYFSRASGFSLRELAAVFREIGRDEKDLAQILFGWTSQGFFLKFRPDDVWPYFAEHPRILEDGWREDAQHAFMKDLKRTIIFKVLAMFPTLPPHFVRMCWDIAFNGGKKDRTLAQAALAHEPGKEERIIASLSGGKAEHRAIAAEWLGKLGCKEAIPALKKSLAKEKQEQAAGAMMVALESLGLPLDEVVSMDNLLVEARKLVAKGIPAPLSWLNLENLPRVRWAKTDEEVPREIIQWMILQSYKLGSPEPGPRLRQYASHFDRRDAEELGQYLLEAWIAQDTIPHTHEQAHEVAEQIVNMWGQGAHDSLYQQIYNSKLSEPVGSATKEKGILAVSAACCGGRAAAPAERYLKTYYGHRVHQCKALIRMLSWIEHPSAIQVLLSISGRFRTASIRKEAEACVNELAERKSWTIDELADRTIPNGGIEGDSGLVIDYGGRRFMAKLNDEFKLVLQNEEGKTIKALPSARQGEDEETVKAAKKTLTTAKKEIDSVLKLQKERLYEAMCTQRTWTFADWDRFLNRHPIVRHYCQRLVWCVLEDGKPARTFRPLEDGTLTDTDDEAVELSDDTKIGLAHECLLSEEVIRAWQQHLADYEVRPLFDQFGRGSYRLPESKARETSIDDFRGHLLDAFRLRGRLTKLGYVRGETGDGGWFDDYEKHFPGLGINATIEFTGNCLPEVSRTVALTSLRFQRATGDRPSYWEGLAQDLPLDEVPPVLLSECWNDMRLAAAEGPGFDPDWEKKSAL